MARRPAHESAAEKEADEKRRRADAPTIPPPRHAATPSSNSGKSSHARHTAKTTRLRAHSRPPDATDKRSGVKAKDATSSGAAVDEVTADLSRDPRREED